MKRLLPLILLFCPLALHSQSSFLIPVQTTTGQGISGATVTLTCTDITNGCVGKGPFSATSTNGNAAFTAIPAGNYTVAITGPNLTTFSYAYTVGPGLSSAITTTAAATSLGSIFAGPHVMTNATQALSRFYGEYQVPNGSPGMTAWFGLLNGTNDCSVKTALNTDNIALTGAFFRCTGGTAGSNFGEGGNFHCWFNAPGSNCMGIESDVNNFDALYPEGDGRGGYGVQIGGNSTFLAGKAIYVTNPITGLSQFQDGYVSDAVATTQFRSIDPGTTLSLIQARRSTDTQNRFVADNLGAMSWGPGGASATDTTLSRTGVNSLTTGGFFGTQGLATAFSLQTSAHTLSFIDAWINVTGTTTITVPHAFTGQRWHVENTNPTSGTLLATLTPDSGTINGIASLTLPPTDGAELTCDGTNCQAGITLGFSIAGTATMTTAAITAGNCGTTVTVPVTGVLTTDTIQFSFNAAPAGSNAGLVSWPTAGNVNFAYCPNSAETPAAATINWKVMR